MNDRDITNQMEMGISKFFAPDKTSIETLQRILGEQSGHRICFADAQDVGIQLVSLYECLARDKEHTVKECGNEPDR